VLDTLSDDTQWNYLIERIREGKCTPFLGAGVNDPGILPLGSTIADEWAKDNTYPLEDSNDLARVAQYLAITKPDPMACKEEMIRKWFRNVTPPNFKDLNEPLGVLAELPLPIYMTTNYDSLMIQALKSKRKEPYRELCRWNNHPSVTGWPSVWDKNRGFRPNEKNPVVYHLHGTDEIYESLVLTEDDYVDFLVNISRRQAKLLPPFVQERLAGTSLIFIGYRMTDWTFRVIFRGLINSMEPGLRRISVAVQLPIEAPEPQRQRMREYLGSYYKNMSALVYWGTAKGFAAELRQRCQGAGIIP
jgi:SIR2-like domain